MHFYYIDESGDSGIKLDDPKQPILVLGGISVRDTGWNRTQESFENLIAEYFGEDGIPDQFELHTHELMGPKGKGPFQGHDAKARYGLCNSILDLLIERRHRFHYFAVNKAAVRDQGSDAELGYDAANPYLLAFDYLVTYIDWDVKRNLGNTARGMIILDQKKELHASVEDIMRSRRYEGATAHRVKWISEFSYPVDSKKNPMIQLSDLVVYCVRRFLEIDSGYRDKWPEDAKRFYARCFEKISGRMNRQNVIERKGTGAGALNSYLKSVQAKPNTRWKHRYPIG